MLELGCYIGIICESEDLTINHNFSCFSIFMDYVYSRCCFARVINVSVVGTKGLREENILSLYSIPPVLNPLCWFCCIMQIAGWQKFGQSASHTIIRWQ